MNIKHTQFRINSHAVRHTNSHTNVTSFFSKAIDLIKEKSSTAFSKLQNKLAQTPSVFIVPHKSRDKMQSVAHISQPTIQPIDNTARAKSILSEIDGEKLKLLLSRKQELMDKLRKIDNDLMNPMASQLSGSRASQNSPLRQQYSMKNMQSRIKLQQKQTYNTTQHQKTIEMLGRLNNEKMRRQERIINQMKKKQQKEIKKLTEIENNKSQLFLNRQNYLNAKFNQKQTQSTSNNQTMQLIQPTPATLHKLNHDLNALPQITSQEVIPSHDQIPPESNIIQNFTPQPLTNEVQPRKHSQKQEELSQMAYKEQVDNFLDKMEQSMKEEIT